MAKSNLHIICGTCGDHVNEVLELAKTHGIKHKAK